MWSSAFFPCMMLSPCFWRASLFSDHHKTLSKYIIALLLDIVEAGFYSPQTTTKVPKQTQYNLSLHIKGFKLKWCKLIDRKSCFKACCIIIEYAKSPFPGFFSKYTSPFLGRILCGRCAAVKSWTCLPVWSCSRPWKLKYVPSNWFRTSCARSKLPTSLSRGRFLNLL